MHILLIHQYFHENEVIGGSRFNEMAEEWSRNGHHITVLAGMIHYAVTSEKPAKYRGRFLVKESYSENIEVIRCHVSESYNKSFIGRLWAYVAFVVSSTIGGVFKARGNFDVLLATSPPLFVGVTAYVLSRLKRVPLVFEIRDLWPESAIDTGVLTNRVLIKFSYLFERFIYNASARINVLTPAFREVLIDQKDVAANKICFIPNAADFRLSEPLLKTFDSDRLKRELGLENTMSIIYVGAHGIANNLIQIMEAAKLLRDQPVKFLLIGDGMEKPMLLDKKAEWQLDNVVFLDPVPKEKVLRYILAADIGTSVLKRAKAFRTIYSNKTFDYMSCKKPILMAIDGVSRQLVADANCGIFVEPENPHDFAAKALQYLKTPKLITLHGENGYKFARTHFDRTTLANQYLTELQTVIS